jgi:hypothetical protein
VSQILVVDVRQSHIANRLPSGLKLAAIITWPPPNEKIFSPFVGSRTVQRPSNVGSSNRFPSGLHADQSFIACHVTPRMI